MASFVVTNTADSGVGSPRGPTRGANALGQCLGPDRYEVLMPQHRDGQCGVVGPVDDDVQLGAYLTRGVLPAEPVDLIALAVLLLIAAVASGTLAWQEIAKVLNDFNANAGMSDIGAECTNAMTFDQGCQ